MAKIQGASKEAEQQRQHKKQQLEALKVQLQAIAVGVASDEGNNIYIKIGGNLSLKFDFFIRGRWFLLL